MSIDLFAILKAVWAVISFALIGVLRVVYSDYKKTQERLDQYIAFFEPQTSDKALERNILMGIKTIAARVNLIEKEKAAVESALKDY